MNYLLSRRRPTRSRQRSGATAVEFALVAPVIFFTVFALIELSRLMMLNGNVNSAVLIGVRQASLARSSPADVRTAIEEELGRFSIREATIQFVPTNFDIDDDTVGISVDVPVNGANGFSLTGVLSSTVNIRRSIEINRESSK